MVQEAFATKLSVAEQVETEAENSEAIQQHLANIRSVLASFGLSNVTISVGDFFTTQTRRRLQLAAASVPSLDTINCVGEAFVSFRLTVETASEVDRDRISEAFREYQNNFENDLNQGPDILSRCATPQVSDVRLSAAPEREGVVLGPDAFLIAIGVAFLAICYLACMICCCLYGIGRRRRKDEVKRDEYGNIIEATITTKKSRIDRVRTFDARKHKEAGHRLLGP